MNEFIEKNIRLLEFYHFSAQIIGWILIGITPFFTIVLILLRSPRPTDIDSYLLLLSIRSGVVNFLFIGLILLGIARFIRYLYSEEQQPGWILRNTEIFLYVYAFLIAAGILIEFKNPGLYSSATTLQEIASYVIPQIMIRMAQVLIIVGLAHILRRILPVIEESKTLV